MNQETNNSNIESAPRRVVPLRAAPAPLGRMDRSDTIRSEMRQIFGEADSDSRDDDLSDRNVMLNPRAFRKRFGPGFIWSDLHRAGLMELINHEDLTDFEVQLLHWSGCLKRTRTGVELSAHWLLPVWGAIALGYWSFVCLLPLLLTSGSTHQPWISAQASIALVCSAAIGVGLYGFYIHSWAIVRRRRLRRKAP